MRRLHIRITNHTKLRTCDLRRFAVRAVRQVDKLTDGELSEKGVIWIQFHDNSKGYSNCWGRAWLGGTSCWVNALAPLRRRTTTPAVVDPDWDHGKIQLATILAHELGHLAGLDHRDMRTSYRELTWNGNFDEKFAWAVDLPLGWKVERKKVAVTGLPLAEQKLAHAEAKVREWESKQKRAKTGIRSWKKKATYYRSRVKQLAD